ncbi:hypothetical protein JXA88_06675 [Candidatus Fermentibacteria bacterium]|nr:hypothetical protein [Candidatus Fermentibacteria bacterium]
MSPKWSSCKGLAAIPGTTGFDVGELLDGTSNAAFAYRVVAKRKGFEDRSLDCCAAAEQDSCLFPELREKELREHEEKQERMVHATPVGSEE